MPPDEMPPDKIPTDEMPPVWHTCRHKKHVLLLDIRVFYHYTYIQEDTGLRKGYVYGQEDNADGDRIAVSPA